MSLTLSRGDTVEILPKDLLWTNEFKWSPVDQAIAYSLNGALLVDVAARHAGRPITLEGAVDAAWMQREQCLRLADWVGLPGERFVLAIHGTTRQVIFDQSKSGIEAEPLVGYSDPDDADFYIIKLHFLEVKQ